MLMMGFKEVLLTGRLVRAVVTPLRRVSNEETNRLADSYLSESEPGNYESMDNQFKDSLGIEEFSNQPESLGD